MGPGDCHDCPDCYGQRAPQPDPEPRVERGSGTPGPRRAARGPRPPARLCRLLVYRFFLASFLGLLLAEGAAALGFLVTSALLGSNGSASASWDLGRGTMMASTQMSWKMAPRKSPYRSRFSKKVGSGTSGGEKSRSEAMAPAACCLRSPLTHHSPEPISEPPARWPPPALPGWLFVALSGFCPRRVIELNGEAWGSEILTFSRLQAPVSLRPFPQTLIDVSRSLHSLSGAYNAEGDKQAQSYNSDRGKLFELVQNILRVPALSLCRSWAYRAEPDSWGLCPHGAYRLAGGVRLK